MQRWGRKQLLGVDERLRCGQFSVSSSVKAIRKEVVARGRCGGLLLFNKWWGIELEEGCEKVKFLGVFFQCMEEMLRLSTYRISVR